MPSSLGPAEILVILVIALIVLGPSRLPEAGRQVGKALSEIRRWTQDVRSEMEGAFQPEPPTASMPTSAPVFDPMPSNAPTLDAAPTAPIEDALVTPNPATPEPATHEPATPESVPAAELPATEPVAAPEPSRPAAPEPSRPAATEAAHDVADRPEAPADNR
jgi:Tat protein translocase TatB subunit